MLALFPIWVFLCALVVWVSFFYTTRYVSVASIFAAASLSVSSTVLALFGKCDWLLVPVAFLMTVLADLATQVQHRTPFCGNRKKIREKSPHHQELKT